MVRKILFGFLIVSSMINGSVLQRENILGSHDDSPHIIQFCTTRNLTDGALKTNLVEQLKTMFNIDAFIETGTYLGDTTLVAAKLFEKVHTIELSPELCLLAKERFKDWKNVVVHEGDSAELLEVILPSVSERVILYLDGHYSGGITAKGSLNTPVIEELERVRDSRKSDCVILIDDIRLFQDSLYPNKFQSFSLDNYPEISRLVEILLQINPCYQICFLGDALLAFPKTPAVDISPVVGACALHRLAGICSDCSEEDLIMADLSIANAKGYERDEIELYYRTYAPFELEYGYRSFGTFWFGLILKQEGKENEAISLFRIAAQNSQPNWRVEQFIK